MDFELDEDQAALQDAARGDDNMLPPMMEAVRTHFPDAQLVEPVEPVRGRKDWSRTG